MHLANIEFILIDFSLVTISYNIIEIYNTNPIVLMAAAIVI